MIESGDREKNVLCWHLQNERKCIDQAEDD